MQNRWALSGRASAGQPSSSTSGDALLPPPFPPDPPDPTSPLSPHLFPPLASTPTPSRSELRRSRLSQSPHDTVMTPALDSSPALVISETTTQFGTLAEISNSFTVPATGNPNSNSPHPTISSSSLQEQFSPSLAELNPPNFAILPPKHLRPGLASSSQLSLVPPVITFPQTHPKVTPPPIPPSQVHVAPPSLVETLRMRGDKSLKRLAPATFSESGRPRVLIPDSVFHKGAELHKDFIICYFNGRPPPFKQIQSVLSHMWGKGRRLEMHNNPLQRSVLVRIPSDYLRLKILDKNIWYVGDSMFHTAQWSSVHSSSTPPLSSIKIWAHLTGVPLDLRYTQGLSLVAGLIGEPKETDDFTLNLVSLTLSHVKVEVDLTKPLPHVVEFERQSGEVVEVQVDYPWLPPMCSHCNELGHVVRNCLLYTPPKVPDPSAPGDKAPAVKPPLEKAKQKSSVPSQKTPGASVKTKHYVVKKTIPPIIIVPPPKSQSTSLPSSPSAFKTPSFVPPSVRKLSVTSTESPPDKPLKPSLKRTRSSPTFSPPVPPKTTYLSSKRDSSHPFPEVGTLRYLLNTPFIVAPTKNSFLPLLNEVDSLQSTGEPPFSS